MKKITLSIAAMMLSMCAVAQNFIAVYSFDSVKTSSGITDPTPVPTASGITFGSFSANGVSPNSSASVRFSFRNWPTGATDLENSYDSLKGAVDTLKYYEVTLTPDAGFIASLAKIRFAFQRSPGGARTYAVRSSIDGFAANLNASINPANAKLEVRPGNIFFLNDDAVSTAQNGSTITLATAAYINFSAPVTFRFYGWNSEASTGTFGIDNVTITGTTASSALIAGFSKQNVCFGNTVTFADSSASESGNVNSWTWDFGDSTFSALQNPTHAYTAPGSYVVKLTVTDDLANVDSMKRTVKIYEQPAADFSYFTLPEGLCEGPLTLNDNSSSVDGTVSSWYWNFDDPTSGTNDTSTLQNPIHTFYNQPKADYLITQIVSSSFGCMDTLVTSIHIDSIAASFFYVANQNEMSFFGSVANNISISSYLWDFDDSSTDTLLNPVHTFLTTGTFNVCFTATSEAFCDDSVCIPVTILTIGMTEKNIEGFFSISPNPSNTGIFRVNRKGAAQGTITVFNILGEQVMSKKVTTDVETIDLSAIANGSYFVTIKTEKETAVRKIIINK